MTDPSSPMNDLWETIVAADVALEACVLAGLVVLLTVLLGLQMRERRGCQDGTVQEVCRRVRGEVGAVQSGAVPSVQALANAMEFLQGEYAQRLAHAPDVLRRMVADEGGALPPKALTQEADFYTEFLAQSAEGTERLRQRMSLKGFELLLHVNNKGEGGKKNEEWHGDPASVSYFIAFSPQRRLVVVSVQDTMSWAGFLEAVSTASSTASGAANTPHTPHTPPPTAAVPFLLHEPRAMGQRYVSRKAQHIVSETRAALLELFVPQGYSVATVGGGVGGGIASLLAVLLKEECGVPGVRAYCFGCPPVVDRGSALGCKSYVTTVVNGSDILPRCSAPALRSFAGILGGVARSLQSSGPQKTRTQLPHILRDAQKGAGLQGTADEGAELYLPGTVLFLHREFAEGATVSATLVDGTLSLIRNIEVTGTILSDNTPEAHELALRQLLARMPPDDPNWHWCTSSPQTRASSGSPTRMA